ncbi:MAG TPA: HAD family hydrolase [Actinomycetota bacterium]|nr:HAD family hydrolase [Actinomycetota bacterium]
MTRLVIFDGDDTLWFVEALYDAARQAARQVVIDAGLDGDRWEQLEREIDVANVSRFGFSVVRFPTSCVEAYRAVSREASRRPDVDIERWIFETASSVFNTPAPLAQDARLALESLRRSHTLILLTRGVAEVQCRRVEESGLTDLFDDVVVVDDKTPDTFRRTAWSAGAQPERSWSVGNSLRSDIVPAVHAGMSAIWIDAHVWEYERLHANVRHTRIWRADALSDVPAIIDRIEAASSVADEAG